LSIDSNFGHLGQVGTSVLLRAPFLSFAFKASLLYPFFLPFSYITPPLKCYSPKRKRKEKKEGKKRLSFSPYFFLG
jgi:hypothetical protein